MRKFCIAGIVCACLIITGGCIVVTDNNFENGKCGIPKDTYRVGGGLEITYIASEDGVINLIDRKACKSLMSKTVTAGEKYEFNARSMDPENEKKWGIDVKKADFVLYFFPTNPRQPLPAQPPVPPTPSQP